MPRIVARRETVVSPWVRLVTKDVEFEPGHPVQTYHALKPADYVSIVARTRGGLVPVVRQYRPAVEAFTYELPAGTVDPGEDPRETCRRELLEETGLTALSIASVGEYFADTGRIENRVYVFQ